MTAPYWLDDSLTLHHGDAETVLSTMDAGTVQTCVTSPPYFGLRDYGEADQIGLEPCPAEYIKRLVEVFREVRRVLRDDGTLWLNLGDSYSTRVAIRQSSHQDGLFPDRDDLRKDWCRDRDLGLTRMPSDYGVPEKNLVGIPWQAALALQADGWVLRSAIVWDKPNAMPESVTDRPSCTYELVFLLAKKPRYHFDLDAIREPLSHPDALARGIVFGGGNAGDGKIGSSARRGGGHRSVYGGDVPPGQRRPRNGGPGPHHKDSHEKGRNPGDLWTIPTSPYPGAHFAVMPPALVRRCVLAGAPEGATVLDPFVGSGTTAMVANQLGRRAVGIDLSERYLALAMQRCKDAPLLFGEAS